MEAARIRNIHELLNNLIRHNVRTLKSSKVKAQSCNHLKQLNNFFNEAKLLVKIYDACFPSFFHELP